MQWLADAGFRLKVSGSLPDGLEKEKRKASIKLGQGYFSALEFNHYNQQIFQLLVGYSNRDITFQFSCNIIILHNTSYYGE